MHYGKPTEGAWAAMKASLGNLAVHNVDQLAAIMMYAVVMEAYIAGVSTRSVDDLVAALASIRASPSPRYPASASAWTR